MKHCPTCHRVENDETLKFCRVDGATLVSDSFLFTAEGETAQLGSASAANEIATSILPHATDANINRATAPTTVLPAQSAPLPTKSLPRSGPGKLLIAVGTCSSSWVSEVISSLGKRESDPSCPSRFYLSRIRAAMRILSISPTDWPSRSF